MNDRRTNALGSPSAEPSLHELSQGGKLNEKESIELIARMISDTKSRLEVGDGNILLSWGILMGVFIFAGVEKCIIFLWNRRRSRGKELS